MGGRVVLHSDLNNCYASIECMLHPELRGKYIAVCGSTEDRHGIVLAKNQLAKQCGVKTGEVIWEARQKCPQLTIVPPHMDQYLKFSRIVRAIYLRYSPEVESFGIDESWIELTGSPLLAHKTPAEIANDQENIWTMKPLPRCLPRRRNTSAIPMCGAAVLRLLPLIARAMFHGSSITPAGMLAGWEPRGSITSVRRPALPNPVIWCSSKAPMTRRA